jgi:hypothetical protein
VQIFFAVCAACCARQRCLYRTWAHGNDLLHGNAVFSRSTRLNLVWQPDPKLQKWLCAMNFLRTIHLKLVIFLYATYFLISVWKMACTYIGASSTCKTFVRNFWNARNTNFISLK